MVALETGRQTELFEREEMHYGETYVFLLDRSGRIFLSGNEKTGLDTIHGFVDGGKMVGEWLIDRLKEKGLDDKDLNKFDVFPGIRRMDFEGKKVEVVGVLCATEIKHKLVYGQNGPAGFMDIDILFNEDYAFLTPNGLGRLVEQLALQGVIHRPDIFASEGMQGYKRVE